MNYSHFEIEAFEVGRGLWRARFRCADRKTTLIDGIEFDFLNASLTWPSVEAAYADARQCIDSMGSRLETSR